MNKYNKVKRIVFLKTIGVKSPPEYFYYRCPYCQKRLSFGEYVKRKKLKICKCGECGHVIDERILMY
jgi:ribosomal protein L37AE/L43A